MPKAARNCSITEVEMCGLAINIASFAHILKRVDFDTVVDHLAITHIMNSFNLYYIEGKDMILSDFLSRQIEDDSNPHEIIPISFNIQDILQENYNHMAMDTYNIQMRAQVKAQANAPTAQDTQPVVQKATPDMIKLPIEIKTKQGSKAPSSRIIQQPQEALCCPQDLCYPQSLCL